MSGADAASAREYLSEVPGDVMKALAGTLRENPEEVREALAAIAGAVDAALLALDEGSLPAKPSGDLAGPPPAPVDDEDDEDAVAGVVATIDQAIADAVSIAGDLQQGIIAAPAELYTALGSIASCAGMLARWAGYKRPAPETDAGLTMGAAMRRRGVREGADHG